MNAQLTAQEITLIELALNYNTREDQLEDNYSNLGMTEVMLQLNCSLKKAVEFIDGSSLFDGEDAESCRGRCAEFPKHAIVYISDDAINAYFDIKDAENAIINTIILDGEIYTTDATDEVVTVAITTVKSHSKNQTVMTIINMIKVLGYNIDKKEATNFTL